MSITINLCRYTWTTKQVSVLEVLDHLLGSWFIWRKQHNHVATSAIRIRDNSLLNVNTSIAQSIHSPFTLKVIKHPEMILPVLQDIAEICYSGHPSDFEPTWRRFHEHTVQHSNVNLYKILYYTISNTANQRYKIHTIVATFTIGINNTLTVASRHSCLTIWIKRTSAYQKTPLVWTFERRNYRFRWLSKEVA
jgi:hypothetical protein